MHGCGKIMHLPKPLYVFIPNTIHAYKLIHICLVYYIPFAKTRIKTQENACMFMNGYMHAPLRIEVVPITALHACQTNQSNKQTGETHGGSAPPFQRNTTPLGFAYMS